MLRGAWQAAACFLPVSWEYAGAHWVVHRHAEGQQQPPHHPQGCLVQQRDVVRLPLPHAHDCLHQHQVPGSAQLDQRSVLCSGALLLARSSSSSTADPIGCCSCAPALPYAKRPEAS